MKTAIVKIFILLTFLTACVPLPTNNVSAGETVENVITDTHPNETITPIVAASNSVNPTIQKTFALTITPTKPQTIFLTSIEGSRIINEDDSLLVGFYDASVDSSLYEYKWYRNGIMIYSSNEGILKNEIMRQFIGNKDEYTPASSHSDHTIRGYLFKVVVYDQKSRHEIGSDEIRIQGDVVTTKMRGVNFVTWETWQTENRKGKKSLEALKNRVNNNWVSIWSLHFQHSWSSPVIFSRFKGKGEIHTLPDRMTIEQINAAHDLGLKVILYPTIWLETEDGGVTPHGRDQLIPSKEWFDSYKKFIVEQSRIAEETKVDIFVIGVELEPTVKYTEKWLDIISEIRKIYHGPITYSPIACCEEVAEAIEHVSWFRELDYLGLSANIEFRKGGKDVQSRDLINYFEKRALVYESLYKRFGKPVILLETCVPPTDGAIMGPFLWDANVVDFQEQADYYNAFLKVFGSKSWVEGIFWNNWLSSQETWYYEVPLRAEFIEFINKPAETVLASWYGKYRE